MDAGLIGLFIINALHSRLGAVGNRKLIMELNWALFHILLQLCY